MKVIFSLDNKVNKPATASYNNVARKFGGKVIEGAYLGVKENSIMIENVDPRDYKTLRDFATANLQDCILVVYSNGHAELDFQGFRTVPLGQWTEVAEVDALKQDGYTKIDNKYFVTK